MLHLGMRCIILMVALMFLVACGAAERDNLGVEPTDTPKPDSTSPEVIASPSEPTAAETMLSVQPTATRAEEISTNVLPTQIADADQYDASATGVLVEYNDCLWLRPDPGSGNRDMLIIWPYGYAPKVGSDITAVRNLEGEVVAKVGARIYSRGGGEGSGGFDTPCEADSLWIAADPIYIIDESPEVEGGVDIPIPTHGSDLPTSDGVISGHLFESGGCLWIISDDSGMAFQVVWPRGYRWTWTEGVMTVRNDGGDITARIGERNTLHGSVPEPLDFPTDCDGPVWLATEPIFPTFDGPPS